MPSRFHVLIVEDEPLTVEVLQGTLEQEYRVSSANTVGQALAFLRTAHVDVVLVDSVLPDGRGAEVARVAETVGAVVIRMSGYSQDMDDLERSQHLYLCKPFGPTALLSRFTTKQKPKRTQCEVHVHRPRELRSVACQLIAAVGLMPTV